MLWAPFPTLPLSYRNSKLCAITGLYGCQNDSQFIPSSEKSFTYMYIYTYMYRNMPLTHCTTMDNSFPFPVSVLVRWGHWTKAVLPNWVWVELSIWFLPQEWKKWEVELEGRCWTNGLPWGRSEYPACLFLGRTVRTSFSSGRTLLPLHCYLPYTHSDISSFRLI